jgi:hypothetical protein
VKIVLHQLELLGIRIIAVDDSHEASSLLQQIRKRVQEVMSVKIKQRCNAK